MNQGQSEIRCGAEEMMSDMMAKRALLRGNNEKGRISLLIRPLGVERSRGKN